MEEHEGPHTTRISKLKEKLEMEPDNQELWFELGNEYWEEGEHAKAKTAYLKALEIGNVFPELLGNLGAVLLELGEIEEAVEKLQKCLSMAPSNQRTYKINLANALFLKGEKNEARELLREALRKANDPEEQYLLRYNLGLMELDEKPHKSVRHFSEATKIKGTPEAYYELACALARVNKISQSAAALKKAIEQDSTLANFAIKDPDLEKTVRHQSISALLKRSVKKEK